MGKRFVIIGFLLCFGIAVYLFLQRDATPLRKTMDPGSKREPRMVLEEFTAYRYKGSFLESQISSRLGQVFEPNVVELDGEIKGQRFKGAETETFEAEAATITFDAKSLSKMMEGTQLVRAELNGFIEVGLKEHMLSTDAAVYTAADDLLSSRRPVRVDGRNRLLTSEDGFDYNISQESLHLMGQVKGVFTRNAK